MKTHFSAVAALVVLGLAGSALAQNARGAAVGTLGTHRVSIDYGRPALKGRDLKTLLKDLPADRIWRAGENQVSTLTTDGPLTFGGKKVPAGKYSLYVHAGENGAWALVLNSDLGVPLGQIWDKAPDNMKNEPWPHLEKYSKAIGAKEVLRAKLKPTTAATPVDLFTVSFTPKGTGADLTLAWGKEAWSIEVQPAK
jgi:hypothetical protein